MSVQLLRRRAAYVAVALFAVTAVACGDDDDDDDAATAGTAGSATEVGGSSPDGSVAGTAAGSTSPAGHVARARTSPAATAAEDTASVTAAEPSAELVAAATEEGKVVLYSSQDANNLKEFELAFEAKYPGIDVDALRMLDGDMPARIEAERNNGVADMYVTAAAPTIADFAAQGFFVDSTGPTFSSQEYIDGNFMHEGFFEVGSTPLVPAWNTDAIPEGLTSYEDFLDPSLYGRIGVPEPTAASFVDMYLWMEEQFGPDFVPAIAAQDPKIYASATATGQAVVSNEISGALLVPPPIPDMESGAPIDYFVPEEPWGAVYFGGLLESGPHPNAAQLLADFMITREGQEVIMKNMGSLYEDVPGTLTNNGVIRRQDTELLTPEYIAQFQSEWAAMFQ